MSRPDNSAPVAIADAKAIRETTKAIQVAVDGREVWIPKSQILDESEVFSLGTSGKLVVPRWLAVAKELVDEEDLPDPDPFNGQADGVDFPGAPWDYGDKD